MRLVCLHNVIGEPADAFDRKCSRVSAEEFGDFLDRTAARWDLVSFSDFERALDEGRREPRMAALSFDDGFLGVHRHAFPLLRARGLDAAAFVNPPLAERGGLFHFLEIEIAFRLARRPELRLDFLQMELDLSSEPLRVKAMKTAKKRLKTMPELARAAGHETLLEALGVSREEIARHAAGKEKYAVMSRAELLELRAAGWRVGSHTLSHRTLGMLDEAAVREEVLGSKRELEALLGGRDEAFAYPYGEPVHVGPIAPRACRDAGYRRAYTTTPLPIGPDADPLLLPRLDYKVFVKECLS